MSLKHSIRALAPAPLLSLYHWLMSWWAVLLYGFPALRLVVAGVTGTKGKSSTCSMLWHILEQTGHRTGLVSTAQFAVSRQVWLNDLKMTMPSRSALQQLFRRMVREGCTHAVVETSSEGLAQWRHVGLPYHVAVLTNLAPEHLQAHGGFEAYRSAKARLFQTAARGGGIAVLNLDDNAADYFTRFAGRRVWGYTFQAAQKSGLEDVLSARLISVTAAQVEFEVQGVRTNLSVGGEFNAQNALAAMTAALALGVPLEKSAAALASFPGTPGRLEFVQHQPFAVVVDYAHTVESLEAVYRTLKGPGKLIAVLGSCGGGRDKQKREPLGKLAGQYADYVVVTDEDPYDEEPRSIMEVVAAGARVAGKRESESLWIIEDRRAAIHHALTLAKAGDVVVITGKGAEQWLMKANGKKIPWDDRQVVQEELAPTKA
ncbi:MAG: UDP-N-acetylmuramoyl-L-alanyl-D-glutamate--2,6-diaminopimelate ligase [Candidatus Veblenbacteria bacterium]|nr:UDP-N-acetylmuramoyl-L-alanyl-D-glutamate--2,6-diaminopimelate ligase [Candidatus Veblenbacteria bacterium]